MMTDYTTNPHNISPSVSGSDVPYVTLLAKQQLMPHDSTYMVKNKMSSNKDLSTKSFSFIENMWQKITKILIPAEQPLNFHDKKKQSVPDIVVDSKIRTPFFELTTGKARLSIPDQNKHISFSLENTTLERDPAYDTLGELSNKSSKRIEKHWHGKDFTAKNSNETNKKQIKCKMSIKNRNEKIRHNLLADMLEDYRQDANSSEQESDVEFYDAIQQASFEVQQNMKNNNSKRFVPTCTSLYDETFPDIERSVNVSMSHEFFRAQHTRQTSECDSEDSFVIFSDDAPQVITSTNPIKQQHICAKINHIFAKPLFRRQRQISECSDDSIVFCYENDCEAEDIYCETMSTGENSSDEEDIENRSSFENSESNLSQQLDSGFEEKKVRFNLNPEVHVIRVWDFASRQARKGEWETAARDRERFRKRIEEIEPVLKPVFDCNLRETVFRDRFSC
ncbi:uncharacterized protein LOC129723122 [Wyeomyia smithii]|uniref:uncharacterized protein LOC129723122 n=1 Tax=Wyeomyia smithii TaxID=174621 RepID=UPI0024681F35|nr:uncharacterized protein LOC129723122 [Wyeomyia smithii]